MLDFRPAAESELRPELRAEPPELIYGTPTAEFAVSCIRIDDNFGHEIDAAVRHEGPQLLVCTRGALLVHAKSSSVTLQRGQAAWVPADDGPIRFVADNPAEMFRVSVGL